MTPDGFNHSRTYVTNPRGTIPGFEMPGRAGMLIGVFLDDAIPAGGAFTPNAVALYTIGQMNREIVESELKIPFPIGDGATTDQIVHTSSVP
jgi:hypothetical protein